MKLLITYNGIWWIKWEKLSLAVHLVNNYRVPKNVIKMQPNKHKIKESVLKQDGSVEIVKDCENNYSKHLFAIYSLLVLSFTLHLYVIINSAQIVNNETEKVEKQFLHAYSISDIPSRSK